MKKILGFIAGGVLLAVIVAALLPLHSCNKQPKPLALYGEWQERDYPIYDTVRYDTIIYRVDDDGTVYDSLLPSLVYSFSRQRLFFDCPQFDEELKVKTGDFRLYLTNKHKPSLSSPREYVYTEYIRGAYFLDEANSVLKFEGHYFTDSLGGDTCTYENTHWGYGSYFRQCQLMQIDETELTIWYNDTISADFNTFIRPEGAREITCY